MVEGLLYYMGSLLPCPTGRLSEPALGYCEQMYLRI